MSPSSSTKPKSRFNVFYVGGDADASRLYQASVEGENPIVQDLAVNLASLGMSLNRTLTPTAMIKCNLAADETSYNQILAWLHNSEAKNEMKYTDPLKRHFERIPYNTELQGNVIDVVCLHKAWNGIRETPGQFDVNDLLELLANADTLADLRKKINSRLDNDLLGPKIKPDEQIAFTSREKAVTFYVPRIPASGRVNWEHVRMQNSYNDSSYSDPPEHIKRQVHKPRKLEDRKEFCESVLDYFISPDEPNKNEIIKMFVSDDANAIPYEKEGIMHHFITLGAALLRRTEDDPVLKLDSTRTHVFDPFKAFWELFVDEKKQNLYGTALPFHLLAVNKSDGRDDVETRQYLPRPDFFLSRDKFPYFFVEFDSHDDSQDYYRMQVQMACSLRLKLVASKKAEKKDEYFLMGAFFAKTWDIKRVFCYVESFTEHEQPVYFHEKSYNMRNAQEFTKFLFEFYNYASYVKSDESDVGIEDIQMLEDAIKARKLENLTQKPSQNSSKRKRDGGETNASASRSTPNYDTLQQRAAKLAFDFDKVGYKTCPDNYAGVGSTRFKTLPENVVKLLETPGGRRVFAKLVQKNSRELDFLLELSSIKSPHNHVIPLLKTVECLDSRLYIILPSMDEFSVPTSRTDRPLEAVRLSHELVEGVAFLHRRGIAHLDIKPDNLVCDCRTRRLNIIDFDTAVRCMNEDEMVEMSCGTPGWNAPEVVLDDKPLRAFNPIRADLWSCGRVLQFLGMGTDMGTGTRIDPRIDQLTDKLVSFDPRHRPLLHKIVHEEQDFWTTIWPDAVRSVTACEKVQGTVNATNNLKRVHDNIHYTNGHGSGSPPKLLRLGICAST